VTGLVGLGGVLAHGVGGRTDLPLPLWLFSYGAGAVLLASFAALRVLWRRPRLREAAPGAALPSPVQLVTLPLAILLRGLGILALAVVFVAAWWGPDDAGANIAPIAVYVVFWVGLQVVSALAGDVWSAMNPLRTIAAPLPRTTARADPGHWTAAAMVLSFVWLELAYHDPSSPRVVGTWLAAYCLAALAGAVWWGRDWLRHGEGFAAIFGLLAHLAPLHRDAEGRLRVRPPLAGLTDVELRPGTAALVFVTLGSTTFDGLTRTETWIRLLGDRTGWAATAVNTVGLLWMIALVAAAYLAATRVVARMAGRDPVEMAMTFLPSLVPILFAYTLAHYFSLLVFEGQNAYVLASDPFGRGWDLFGTIDWRVNFTVVSTDTIAYVQAGAIVVGHVAGVITAHDRAVELFRPRLAERSQYPMLGVMVLFTVGGLGLLLGG